MTISDAIDRGLAIRKQIKELNEEMELVESVLRAAALEGEQIDLNDPDREGKQWLGVGSAHTVPVVLTADLIVGQFAEDSPAHMRLKEIAGEKLREFFRRKVTWENLSKGGKQFRSLASAILEEKAPAFITAALARDKHGIPKSQIKVEWDRAEEIAS